MKLSKYVNDYYEYDKNLSEFSRYAFKTSFAKNVYPFLNDAEIDSISTEDIRKLIDQLEKEIEHNSVWSIFRELRKIFRHAKQNGAINNNPCESIDYFFEAHIPQSFSAVELELINTAIKQTPLAPLYQMTLACGIKLTELLVLTWHDVNFTNNTIYIQKRAPFAGKPRKTINVQDQMISYHITTEIRKILEAVLLSQYGRDNPLDLVFMSKKGNYLPYYLVDKSNQYVKNTTGIDDFCFRKLETHYKLTHKK